MSDADRALWAEARTLLDIGELMAQWLEGRISYQPGYGHEGPDEETSDLVEALEKVNRAGFVTDFSQPGGQWPTKRSFWTQRAAIAGFCDEALTVRLNGQLVGSDLVVLRFQPEHECGGCHIPLCVSLDGHSENTWIGGPFSAESIDSDYADDLHPDGLAALHAAWQLQIVDPIWGRNDLLWPAILKALK